MKKIFALAVVLMVAFVAPVFAGPAYDARVEVKADGLTTNNTLDVIVGDTVEFEVFVKNLSKSGDLPQVVVFASNGEKQGPVKIISATEKKFVFSVTYNEVGSDNEFYITRIINQQGNSGKFNYEWLGNADDAIKITVKEAPKGPKEPKVTLSTNGGKNNDKQLKLKIEEEYYDKEITYTIKYNGEAIGKNQLSYEGGDTFQVNDFSAGEYTIIATDKEGRTAEFTLSVKKQVYPVIE